MIDLPAIVLSLLLIFDGSPVELDTPTTGPDMPPNIEINAQEKVRIPWAARTYDVGSAPVIVEQFEIEAAQAAADLEPEPKALREKNRIPNPHSPELNEIERLRALLLPPSDRVQVFQPSPATKSVTQGAANWPSTPTVLIRCRRIPKWPPAHSLSSRWSIPTTGSSAR